MERKFDEVMIVNPGEPDTTRKVRLMRFHNVYPDGVGDLGEPYYGYYGEPAADYGYFAEEPYLSEDMSYGEVDPLLGYYGQADPAYGYYGELEPGYGYYGEVDPAFGYYGEPYYGEPYYGEPYYGTFAGWGEPDVYGQAEPVGYFAEEFPVGYYGEDFPVGDYGEEFPVGYYGEAPYEPVGYYGQVPEMVGYGEPELQAGEYYPGIADYGGYVREVPLAFNPGCPVPTNVSGLEGLDGYVRPATVNASCGQFTAQAGAEPSLPETFKPLW
jgi:hypothetical protein